VRSDSPLSRGPAERALAWLYTGPLGHLYGVVADLLVLWARYAASRLRKKRYWPGGV
jgi:hypothetical protein